MITHTIESYWIPSQKKTNSYLQIEKKLQKIHNYSDTNFTCDTSFEAASYDVQYEMDPTSIVEDTERTLFCPQTDRQTRRWNQYTPLSTSLRRGYNYLTHIFTGR